MKECLRSESLDVRRMVQVKSPKCWTKFLAGFHVCVGFLNEKLINCFGSICYLGSILCLILAVDVANFTASPEYIKYCHSVPLKL